MSWFSGLKAKVLVNEALAKHTTLKSGPKAGLWIEPLGKEDLKALIKRCGHLKKEYFILGLGSKVLFKSKKVPLVIHLGSDNFKRCVLEGSDIIASAGVSLNRLLAVAYENGLGGLEFLSGIPASVGGALALNAGVGWPVRLEIGTFVYEAEVMDRLGRVRILSQKELKFGYRGSNLKSRVILGARFRLFKKRRENIRIKMDKFLDYRKATQDLGYPSAGCVFKNSNGQPSGRLIDLCGLKGSRIGDAQISAKHGNFIINLAKADSKDIVSLIKLAQRKVKAKFGVTLEPEIQII
ncbi:MAG: UDP-N-acetylenolpyruvoylglucosamine reductase [Omnitrophica WOR_2 bacterium RIFOXYB2_FULL_45_11]|nr:MAG: UDP-N-acetylenolpyruvoylglucosamine reductase [Omnitrophica WOR_2 bacterium RIFOXYB2_FULL_45_11]